TAECDTARRCCGGRGVCWRTVRDLCGCLCVGIRTVSCSDWLAEGARFELADPLRGLQFSRLARSAAPSPLRANLSCSYAVAPFIIISGVVNSVVEFLTSPSTASTFRVGETCA